jgi:thiol:disulfide interchange protein DsbD
MPQLRYMRAMIRLLVLLGALLALLPAVAQTGPVVETGHASSRLIARDQAFVPGETAWVGLHQELEEGWHVYWRNPGDSGLPLLLDWTLPVGFEAGEVIYPQPHRLPLGPLVNFGHEGSPTFLIPIEVPTDAAVGDVASLSVEATWLICLDICVPESARLTLDVPVAAEAGGLSDRGSVVAEALAARPTPAPFSARFEDEGRAPVLTLEAALEAPEFYPFEPNLIEPSGRQEVAAGNGLTSLRFDAGFAYEEAPETLFGLVVAGPAGERTSYVVEAPRAAGPLASAPAGAGSFALAGAAPTLLPTLLFAFLGGLILNVMPCVFPVVFMKAAGLAGAAAKDRATVRRQGLLYTMGVLLTFLLIAGVLLGLRAGGEQLGWGFQLQNPVVVGLFAVVIFLVGLNLAGVFEVGTSVQGVGQGLAAKGGDAGAFFTGMLAVAVAAPCIGPFLGVPVGYALSGPLGNGLLVFLMVGFGLAAPYLALSFAPGLGRLLPKPGPWMATFRQLLSFAMFGTLVWLAWVLSLQAGAQGVLLLGVALVLAGFAAWAFGRSQGQGGTVSRLAAGAALALCVLAIVRVETVPPASAQGGALAGVPYSEETLSQLRAEGVPVFVDFTAAWCVTCQVNKQTVLTREAVTRAFAETDTAYMVADWTVQDPEITAALEQHGRSGVPLYLYYEPGADAPSILPQILSVDGVVSTLKETS